LFRNEIVNLGIEKNGGRLFRRPKLTLSCSAEGEEGREAGWTDGRKVSLYLVFTSSVSVNTGVSVLLCTT
jgi:hypothetical protein